MHAMEIQFLSLELHHFLKRKDALFLLLVQLRDVNKVTQFLLNGLRKFAQLMRTSANPTDTAEFWNLDQLNLVLQELRALLILEFSPDQLIQQSG